MRIQSQLVILVMSVLAPVSLLAALASIGLWEIQREAYLQTFQERVRALRLALDTELGAMVRELRTLSESPVLDVREPTAEMADLFARVLRNNTSWASIGLAAPDGRVYARLDQRAPLAAGRPHADSITEVVGSRGPHISNLVDVQSGAAYVTYVAAPVIREGEVRAALFVGIEHTAWLDFFARFPIPERATLTLNDRNARIIARTLDNERWAGKRAPPEYWDSTLERSQGWLVSAGVDGQSFYSAFSRSQLSDWVLGTGVPQADVEAALRRPALAILLGVLSAAGIAFVATLVLGGRIIDSLSVLANAVRSMASGRGSLPQEKLPVDEAETVRLALLAGHEELAAREASLNEALALEARSRAAAERASQAKDDLLAMLGHELRNPLSAIRAAVTILETPGASAEMTARAREVVNRQVGHLAAITDELLDVARLASGKTQLRREPLDLAAIARHVVESFVGAQRCAGLDVRTHIERAPVCGDETRLEQIVANLLDNACKYTPPGGRIDVSVAVEGDAVVLTVADSGSGIGPELLPHVFELFSQGERTLDRSQGGLGLGLTVVRRLVELHGGTVEADSAGIDRGARFRVRLPRFEAQAQPSGGDARRPQLPALDIAVIEDNADNRDVVAEVLRMRGHRVLSAEDGIQGVEAILAGPVDVALVDIGLPGYDGYEVARRVRAASGGDSVLLIALTGYGRDEDRVRALTAGFDDFLVKPFDVERFEALLAQSARCALSRPSLRSRSGAG